MAEYLVCKSCFSELVKPVAKRCGTNQFKGAWTQSEDTTNILSRQFDPERGCLLLHRFLWGVRA